MSKYDLYVKEELSYLDSSSIIGFYSPVLDLRLLLFFWFQSISTYGRTPWTSDQLVARQHNKQLTGVMLIFS
jgi:hypothetical protein